VSFSFGAVQTVTGDITDVIVYRGQALVTRAIQMEGQEGDLELIVENLPERILSESLYAQADGGVKVLSVRYREKMSQEDNREEVKKLEAQIEAINRKLYNIDRDRQMIDGLAGHYWDQWKLTYDAAGGDLDRAVLEPEKFIAMIEFLEGKNTKAHQEAVALENQRKDLEKELGELDKVLQELREGHQTVHREAVVYLHKPSDKRAQLDLSYLVQDAGWSPQYNLWAQPADSKVRMEYLAVVHQASGEDWTSASLALSTAEPTQVASPPILDPMEITLGPGQGGYWSRFYGRSSVGGDIQMPQQAADQVQYVDQSQAFESLSVGRRAAVAKGILAQVELNEIAISNQMMELEADKRLLTEMKQKSEALARREGVSVMYALPGKLTLPSRSDQQLVTIASEELPAVYTLLASPLLTDYVYLWGQVTNSSDTILLPGPSSMYRNGEFVGRGQMPLLTIGQSFDSGFGIDSQVQVVREFKDKKIETLWGNRIDQSQYTLSISNYKNESVRLRLIERIPWTENEQIEILLTEISHPLSADPEYVQKQKDKGVLRWDLDLPPNTTSAKATAVTYSYTIKYDGEMHIQPVAKAQP
jgi:hypothetical protein